MNIAQNPNSELSHFAVNTPQVFEIPETFRETARQFQEAMMQYSCAIREFKTKRKCSTMSFPCGMQETRSR